MLAPYKRESVQRFVELALPYSNWGQTYFDIRLFELDILDGMFPTFFQGEGQRALDVGCGIGLACAYLSQTFDRVDGTDISEIGVAFNVDRPSPIVGAEMIAKAGIENVSLQCGDTFQFLANNKNTYDMVMSVFVMEHVEAIDELCQGISASLKKGGRTLHIVPNTHDTIIQLLQKNLAPFWQNLKMSRRDRSVARREGKRYGALFAPITHSEFISDYPTQFEVNALERYVFPMIRAGLKIRDIKPVREHSYAILSEKL